MRIRGRDVGVGAPPLVVDRRAVGKKGVVGGVVVPHVLITVGPVSAVVGGCVPEQEEQVTVTR